MKGKLKESGWKAVSWDLCHPVMSADLAKVLVHFTCLLTLPYQGCKSWFWNINNVGTSFIGQR